LEEIGAGLAGEAVGGGLGHPVSVSRMAQMNIRREFSWHGPDADASQVIESIRVLVVDESPGLAQGLMLALPRRGPISVLGPVADACEALAAIREGLADLVLVAIDRADGRGAEVVSAIRDANQQVRVLASSRTVGPDTVTLALAAGACGMLPPQRDRTLVEVFRRAVAGELVLPAEDLPRLVDRLRSARPEPSGPERLAMLTHRENEILRALSEGRATADIARDLGISPLTVQSHVKNILAKLGVHTKVEAVRMIWRHGRAGS
jgi:DNA-binding NarL/FixJ family response regulator